MKIVFDISVLGLGQMFNTARTGVYRVIEHLLTGISNNADCELAVCDISEVLENIDRSYKYATSTGYLKGKPFLLPEKFNTRVKVNGKREHINSIRDKSFTRKVRVGIERRFLDAIEMSYKPLDKSLSQNVFFKNCQIFHSPFYSVPEYLKNQGKKIFVTSYDLIPIKFPQYCEAHVVDMIKKFADSIDKDTWVTCISESTRNDLLNYCGQNIDPEKVFVTPLAASNNFYINKNPEQAANVFQHYKIPEGKPYLLSLCTLEPRKNIEGVIKAFINVVKQEKADDLNLVLVGTKGWKFETIFSAIADAEEYMDRVIVTGFVDDKDLSVIYSNAMAFIYPSFYEGFGLPPLEAMQCGVPVITSNTSSLPEVVGNAGIMITPTDGDALCNAILTIYKNDEVRKKMSELSIERASKFSWDACARLTIDAYEKSLN